MLTSLQSYSLHNFSDTGQKTRMKIFQYLAMTHASYRSCHAWVLVSVCSSNTGEVTHSLHSSQGALLSQHNFSVLVPIQ